jgi:hypothetical protein
VPGLLPVTQCPPGYWCGQWQCIHFPYPCIHGWWPVKWAQCCSKHGGTDVFLTDWSHFRYTVGSLSWGNCYWIFTTYLGPD